MNVRFRPASEEDLERVQAMARHTIDMSYRSFIDLIMIDHQSHRCDFGSVLLAHCEANMFEQYDAIRLESFERNGKANNFYRKNGWTRMGAVPDAMSGGRKWIFEKRRKL
jgi:ribosomal protein S18 acetylase RimI-like enzyme